MVLLPSKSLESLARLWLLSALVLMSCLEAQCEEPRLTPSVAVQHALRSNSSLAVELYEPALRQADVIRERGQFDPTFTAGLGTQSYGDSSGSSYSVGLEHRLGFGATYGLKHSRGTDALGQGSSQTSLNLRVPLLKGAGAEVNRAGVNTAKGKLKVAELKVKVSALDLAAEVESSFWSLVLAHRVEAVRSRAVEQAKTFLGMLQTEIEAGAAAPYELYEAQQNLASRQAGVTAAQGDIVVARQRLLRLMGISDSEVLVAEDVPLEELLPVSDYQELAMLNRPILKVVEREREILRLQERVANNQALPRLDVVASHRLASTGLSTYGWQAGLQLTIPIGNHEGRGKVNRARTAGAQAEARWEDLRQRVLLETSQAHARVEASARQTEASRQASELAKQRVQAESERFAAGFAPAHRVIIAQQQQLTVDEELLAAGIRQQIAMVALRRAAGTILEGQDWELTQGDRA